MDLDTNEFDQLAAPGYPIFLGSEFKHPKPEDAFFHILPIPYEESVSYGGGTGLGPAAILEASWQLETWDGTSNPSTKGIYTHPPVDMAGSAEQVIANIALATTNIIERGGFPIGLGGEHTVTYGIIKGLLDAGIDDFGVVQIDAHADLREAYEGNPYSHASVMKRIVDLGVPLFQLGIRAYCEEEMRTRKAHGVRHIDADILVPQNIQKIDLPDNFPSKVFFTLDIDGMDPSVFPSTGTPVPGGLGWYQTLSLFESVAKQCEIIGFDITEFAPIKGFHAYEFSAALLTYKMMGIIERLQSR
ncbi:MULTISPECIES: agmatinase [unclassified Oleiphilus]|jgi:agmatinase|nr:MULTISPECIES: agmatinase [unclassified Oleiphilus]KZY41629.1 agmatinase [Oleiphilus sp. HI0050]KZY74026.1 agmatinase [Oleiphilus sp. HI0068]KZY84559.1 agmatinase [Oleiphilus sp. HI0069]KZY87658.1 agmatinase [Oleiphilus sp. HI0072]KZZ20631.1 agmatinase [Oleiphilus sp. HI0081]KZZ33170.1 agmatinase [Oleiphilus sp. HI0085]